MYYLVKSWTPHRGQTEENPSCYFCGSYIYHHPLTNVRRSFVYTSRKRAERVALKHNTIYTHHTVIEVPDELVTEP